MNAEEYQHFARTCLEELQAKQRDFGELALAEAHEVDDSKGVLRFLLNDMVLAETLATPIGSLGAKSQTWHWAWANATLPKAWREEAGKLKELATLTGRREFQNDMSFVIPPADLHPMVAIAIHHLGALAMGVFAVSSMTMFFAIKTIKSRQPPHVIDPIAADVAMRALLAADVSRLNFIRLCFPKMQLHALGIDLRGKPAPWANDLHAQDAFDFGLLRTHEAPNLSGADLTHSRFDGAVMRGVNLQGASFEGASLVDVDFSSADLRGASFRDTFLNGANFNRAELTGADFSGAQFSRTLLLGVDLSAAKGLGEARHVAPSEISFSTFVASHFSLTPEFLLQAGVSQGLIADLVAGKRVGQTHETCFLSYSVKDRAFATRLHGELQAAGVRVFFDYFDMVPGWSLEDQIVAAIKEHDRLVVLLTADSMASPWVRREIELAWYHKRSALILIRQCPLADIEHWVGQQKDFPDLLGHSHILDFSDPKEHDHSLGMLLKALWVDKGSDRGGGAVSPES